MVKSSLSSTTPRPRTLRCTIYTRKSHEEGLEQDFNSLDAQREACEAFVLSQKREGWVASPTRYDDGGFSGGTLERPALQRLLADVEVGKVDVVVVYKVDRLTRSLSDFAKIVERFDARGIYFVSVTQQFNTTTSMGRLTLNVLLSFAQFEREVTGERIRDKIAASKKKGIWMGGRVPLGYDAADRKLLVNPQEAGTVRRIFEGYARLGSVRKLKEALDAAGVVGKARKTRDGRPFAPGALYKLLNNPLYIGEIVHKGNRYPGEHEAIIEKALWERVERLLESNRMAQKMGSGARNPSLLAGILYDDRGDRMSPSHAVKKGARYRYYVSRALLTGNRKGTRGGFRLPASDIEGIVIEKLQTFLSNRAEVLGALETHVQGGRDQKRLLEQGETLSTRIQTLPQTEVRRLILALLPRIEVHPAKVDLHLSPTRLVQVLDEKLESMPLTSADASKESPLILSIPAWLKRRGMEMKLVVEGPSLPGEPGAPDPGLVRIVAKAHVLREMLVSGEGISLRRLARREGMESAYFTRLLRLTFLAPDIVRAILDGRQPPELTAARLLRDTRFPLDWREQRTALGFA